MNSNQTEQMFVSGLLHDLGRLILFIHYPKESHDIIVRSRNRSRLLFKEESDYLGCDHAEVGKELVKQWKLPLILENNVYYHHRPSAAQKPVPAAIVHLADIVVNSLGIGSSGEKIIPHFDDAIWENLSISPQLFKPAVDLAVHQLASLEMFFKRAD